MKKTEIHAKIDLLFEEVNDNYQSMRALFLLIVGLYLGVAMNIVANYFYDSISPKASQMESLFLFVFLPVLISTVALLYINRFFSNDAKKKLNEIETLINKLK